MCIEGETFNEYKVQQKKINDAINLLKKNQYIILKKEIKHDPRSINRRIT